MAVFSTNNSHILPETRLHPLPNAIRDVLRPLPANVFSTFVLLAGLNAGQASAAIIQVNAQCTLVNAITAANKDAATGGCSAGSNADIVVLPANTIQTLTVVNNNADLENGLPIITTNITIAGNGSTIKRAAGTPKFRIFAVSGSGILTLNNTKLTGGDIDNSRFPRSSNGGALLIRPGGRVTLNQSFLIGNKAAFKGGGAYSDDGTLILNNSTVSGNSAASFGGGINNFGLLSVNNSTVSANSAHFDGGGLRNYGQLTLNNSTVSGNSVDFNGGGIENSGQLTVSNSTVSGNTANHGGGIDNSGQLTINNSTISGNSVYGFGGGIFSNASLTLSRSLISGNTAGHGPEIYSFGGVVTANNRNLFGHSGDAGVKGFTPGNTDIVPNKPLSAILKPLGVNGGPTQTHLLVKGSPAINASPNDAKCFPKRDQRTVGRPQGLACDIGAVEVTFCDTATPTAGCTVNGIAAQPCQGKAIADMITGTSGPDVILGLGGNDLLRGAGGNDRLCGGTGDDRLEGGGDADQLFGSFGNDKLFGNAGDDKLFGEQGNDTLDGGLGADQLNGGPGIQDQCIPDASDPAAIGCEL